MPIISQFYGIVVKIFFNDKDQHHSEHIHVEYSEFEAVFDFNGNLLAGKFPKKQTHLIQAWILIHQEELKALWKLINSDGTYFTVEPLH